MHRCCGTQDSSDQQAGQNGSSETRLTKSAAVATHRAKDDCRRTQSHIDHVSGQAVDRFLNRLTESRMGMDVPGNLVNT